MVEITKELIQNALSKTRYKDLTRDELSCIIFALQYKIMDLGGNKSMLDNLSKYQNEIIGNPLN